jgi:hypothetical protein
MFDSKDFKIMVIGKALEIVCHDMSYMNQKHIN